MLHLIALLAPISFLLASLLAALVPQSRRLTTASAISVLTLLALAAATVSLGLLAVIDQGTSPAFGHGLYAVSIRHDLLSAVMLVLITFVGWVVTRYSATYLDGEQGQARFTVWMGATLAAVSLLVISGTLLLFVASFIATSLCLHQLLLFYPDRPAAQRAARKKFILSRIADGCLVGAALILGLGYGTGDIAAILQDARAGIAPVGAGQAAALLALAAFLKSAQFPFHGWLTEVMETPTPVSALLHAGLVNAGGFLLIRFADVMLLSPLTMALLVMVGAFTAVFGALVMLTQSAVKTSLAWSTVAQMGFMILQCGLGLFPIALLHILAHSLYKAYAFLSSGTAVDAVWAAKRPGPVAVPNVAAVARAFVIAISIYLLVGLVFGFWHKPPQALALGTILILGVAYLLAQGLADTAPWALTRRCALYSVAAASSYFALQWAAEALMAGTLPAPPQPDALEWALIVLAVLTFALVAVAQALLPIWSHHPAAAGLRVHLQNGLYVNAMFDRLLGHFTLPAAAAQKD